MLRAIAMINQFLSNGLTGVGSTGCGIGFGVGGVGGVGSTGCGIGFGVGGVGWIGFGVGGVGIGGPSPVHAS